MKFRRRQWHATPILFCLENPMDGEAWKASVHGVAKSRTRLSDFTFTFHFRALEKEIASHSSVLAWRIPGTGEPGGLPSMGSHRVGHDWSDLAAAAMWNLGGILLKHFYNVSNNNFLKYLEDFVKIMGWHSHVKSNIFLGIMHIFVLGGHTGLKTFLCLYGIVERAPCWLRTGIQKVNL